MKYHPKRNKEDTTVNAAKFSQISEAYEVLSDPHKKAIYDSLGETALKQGPMFYKYAENPLEIFEQFYASYNPFNNLIYGKSLAKSLVQGRNLEGTMFGSAYGGAGRDVKKPPEELTVACECTLEELYMGCMKKLSLERLILGLDGKSLKKQRDEIEVEVKPGYSNGDKLRFKEKGNEGYEYPNCNSHYNGLADLIVMIKELPHEKYKRKGDDLIYQHKILLLDAICANSFGIESIDHRVIMISLDQIVTPSTKKLIEGEGMPICRTSEKEIIAEYKGEFKVKGNLWITFDIVFPSKIDPKHKEALKYLLEQ